MSKWATTSRTGKLSAKAHVEDDSAAGSATGSGVDTDKFAEVQTLINERRSREALRMLDTLPHPDQELGAADYLRIVANFRMGRFHEVVALAGSVIHRGEQYRESDVLYYKGLALERLGNLDEARKAFSETLERYPEHALARAKLEGNVSIDQGEPRTTLGRSKKWRSIFGPPDLDWAIKDAEANFRDDPDAVAERVGAALERYPDDSRLKTYLGVCAHLAGRHKEAKQVLQEVISENPLHFKAMYYLARICGSLQDRAGEWTYAEAARRINPEYIFLRDDGPIIDPPGSRPAREKVALTDFTIPQTPEELDKYFHLKLAKERADWWIDNVHRYPSWFNIFFWGYKSGYTALVILVALFFLTQFFLFLGGQGLFWNDAAEEFLRN